jgi:hypothetical protein
MTTITAATMSRSLTGRAIRVMFTEVSFPVCPAPVRTLGLWLLGYPTGESWAPASSA